MWPYLSKVDFGLKVLNVEDITYLCLMKNIVY